MSRIARPLDDRLAEHDVGVGLDTMRPRGGLLRGRLHPILPPPQGERSGTGRDGLTLPVKTRMGHVRDGFAVRSP